MKNPLTEVIPAKYRKLGYAAYAFVGIIIGGVQVALSATNSDQPSALVAVIAVYAYLGVALGLTAASNTDTP